MSKCAYISYSALKCFYGCGYRYFLKYVERQKAKENCRNFVKGGVCHSCLSRWIKEGSCEPDVIFKFLDEEWQKYILNNFIQWRNDADKEKLYEEAKEHLVRIQDGFFGLDLHLHSISSEVSYKKWDVPNKFYMAGIVDIVDHTDSSVLDLKVTTAKKYYDTEQGLWYCILLNKGGAGVKFGKFGQFVPLRKEVILWQDFELSDLKEYWRKVLSGLNQIREGKFERTTEKNNCWNCPYSFQCRGDIEVKPSSKEGRASF